jgi:ATP-binding cassette subfamily F protein 3
VRNARIGRVAQEAPGDARSLIDYVLGADEERAGLMAEAHSARDPHRIAEIQLRLTDIGAHDAPARAAAVLAGLGFDEAAQQRHLASYSGGWRMRVALAALLFRAPDLLLLDEPTNYLDLEGALWLESYLRRYRHTVIMVSHDRDLLNKAVQSIIHLDGGKLTFYAGGYDGFERQRRERQALQISLRKRQEAARRHMEAFVERFRAKATKARQAQSRLKMLDRMEVVAAAQVATPFTFSFREPLPASNLLLALEHACAGYGANVVLSDVNLVLTAGARVGLLGANGAGKSTLVKLLAGELSALHGRRAEGKGLSIGYFAQHQLEQLRADESPLQHLIRLDRLAASGMPGAPAREQDLRDFLGGFDFRGDTVHAPVGRFSGGERARLTLALLIWQRPNLLLLDEPTNHLDLDMREALTLALQEYEGAMVLVSHDRHLLRATTDTLLLVAGGAVRPFDGDLDDYKEWLAQRRREQAPAEEQSAAPSRREQRRLEAEARSRTAAQRRPLERELAAVEQELAQLSAEKRRLESLVADPHLYLSENRDRLKTCLMDQAHVNGRLHQAEERWLRLQSDLEAL